LGAVIQLAEEVYQKAVQLQIRRLLVDVRDLLGWLQPTEIYDVVDGEFPRFRGHKIRRLAIVDRKHDEPDQRYFFETVAHNRGYDLRLFADLQEAIDWLVEGLDVEPFDQ
jgi:hypothetical protein